MEYSGVLVVDDDQLILDVAASFFESAGMEVHCASNGAEALRNLRERAFLMMVTDLNMPGMNGLELAGKVREIAPHMPIVMGTGDMSPEISRLAREAGIARVLAKPFDFEEILAMVGKGIEGSWHPAGEKEAVC